eukprot:14216_4
MVNPKLKVPCQAWKPRPARLSKTSASLPCRIMKRPCRPRGCNSSKRPRRRSSPNLPMARVTRAMCMTQSTTQGPWKATGPS